MKVQPLAAQLALLLVRPGSGYRRQLAAAGRAFESVGGEGARQFGEAAALVIWSLGLAAIALCGWLGRSLIRAFTGRAS